MDEEGPVEDFVATSWEEESAGDDAGGEEAKAAAEQERFHRSLLEAKLAYDAVDAALGGAPAAEPAAVAEPEPAVAAEAAAPEPFVPEPVVPKAVLPVEPPEAEMSAETPAAFELAIVPINESTVQFAAGALGAAAGLALGGPMLGAVAAGLFNYLSRKDEDAGPPSSSSSSNAPSAKRIVDAASRTALLGYNFLAQFDKENKVVEATLKLVGKAVDKAKEKAQESDSPAADVLATAESAWGDLASKVEEWNDEYDLVGGAGTVLDGVGAVVETCVDKGLELNDEYKLADRAGGVVKGAVDKVTEKVSVKVQ